LFHINALSDLGDLLTAWRNRLMPIYFGGADDEIKSHWSCYIKAKTKSMPHWKLTLAQLTSLSLFGAAICGLPASASTLINGGFETGDFTGWNVTSPSSYSVPVVPPYSYEPISRVHDGTYAVSFGAWQSSGGVISQTFLTIPNLTYNVSFWYGI
jgi:hypothetical protein